MYFTLFVLFTPQVLSAFPEFSFDATSFPSGPVDVTFEASSGTQIELQINSDFVARQDIIADSITTSLLGSIQNVQVPLGATLTLRNDEPGRIYRINISDGPYAVLYFGEFISYVPTQTGDVLYTDEQEGISKVITVVDEVVTGTFEDVEDFLTDGTNQLEFVQRYPTSTLEFVVTHTHTISYDKYPNTITINSFPQNVNERLIEVRGFVSDATSDLYYVLNTPGQIANPGVLIPIPFEGNNFAVNISAGLREGENTIRFITTEASDINIFNGEARIEVNVDTIPPTLEFETELSLLTNKDNLKLNMTSDADELLIEFNDENFTEKFVNQSLIVDLDLVQGRNNLTLTATDLAGNFFKEAYVITVDTVDPKILEDEWEPAELFGSSGTARFYFQKIEGKTNKPNVFLTLFTFPDGSETLNGTRVTCDQFEPLFIRNLGELDREREFGPELNIDDLQVSLLGFVNGEVQTTSDSNGDFDAIISLQEDDFDSGDVRRRQRDNPRVDSVRSPNTLCVIMEDQFGNFNTRSYRIILDAGNTMWRPGEVTTIPSTLYAAEIEQTGDVRSGAGNVEFGMIVRFQYIGPGFVSNLQSFKVSPDTQGSDDSKHISIDSSRVSYQLDKDTGEMLTYIPVKIKKLNKRPIDYPSDLNLAFEARVNYDVGDEQIPVDERNPIYFQTTVNIEKPLDHTKWLTPATIDALVGFLNKTIDVTRKLTDLTGNLAVGGVLACTGAKFWYGIQVAQIEAAGGDADEIERQKNEALQKLLYLCDRVACSSSPGECADADKIGQFETDSDGEYGTGVLDLRDGEGVIYDERGTISGPDLVDANVVEESDGVSRVLADYDQLRVGRYCVYGRDPDGTPRDGVLIDARITQYEPNADGNGWYFDEEYGQQRINDQCVPAQYPDDAFLVNGEGQRILDEDGRPQLRDGKGPQAIDLRTSSGLCYTEGAPEFDETRCWLPGLGPKPGYDPADNILESARCGCITDTYSHLKNWLAIEEQIKMCLEQARVGEVKGSYCERLLSQAVCDIATNVIFKTASNPGRQGAGCEDPEGTEEGGSCDPHSNIFARSINALSEGDRFLNNRYQDSFLSQAGLGTNQLVNKACVAAISGDFSILTENILTAINRNEVEPVFGPAFAESRLLGYNPLTGDLTIQYRFTYGVVSGGQNIVTKVSFACDPSAPGGEYCPNTYISSDDPRVGSELSTRTLSVGRGEVKQDSVVIKDTQARYRYNVLIMEHTYTVKDETKTRRDQFNIFQKGEFLLANCFFNGGAFGAGSGFRCDQIFSNDAFGSILRINERASNVVPQGYTFYPDNILTVDLAYDYRQDDFTDAPERFDLVYYAVCNGLDGQASTAIRSKEDIDVSDPDQFGQVAVPLLAIPDLGEAPDDNRDDFFVDIEDLGTREEIQQKQADGELAFYLQVINTAAFEQPVSVSVLSGEGVSGAEQIVIPPVLEPGEQTERIKLTFDANTANTEDIILRLNKDRQLPNGVTLRLIIETPDGVQERNFVFRERIQLNRDTFEFLQTGTCDLRMMLVPDGDAQLIQTIDDFENYNQFGDNIDSNVETNNIFTTQFVVGEPTDRVDVGFEIIRPYENQVICLDDLEDENTPFRFKYLYQNSINSLEPNLDVDFSMRVKGYDIVYQTTFNHDEGDFKIEFAPESISQNEVGSHQIYFMKSSLREIFELKDQEDLLDLVLTYDHSYIDNTGNRVEAESDIIEFKAAFNCR